MKDKIIEKKLKELKIQDIRKIVTRILISLKVITEVVLGIVTVSQELNTSMNEKVFEGLQMTVLEWQMV